MGYKIPGAGSDTVGVGRLPGTLPRTLRLDGYYQCVFCRGVEQLPEISSCRICRSWGRASPGHDHRRGKTCPECSHRGHTVCPDCHDILQLMGHGKEAEALERYGSIPAAIREKFSLEEMAHLGRLTYVPAPTAEEGEPEDASQGVGSG